MFILGTCCMWCCFFSDKDVHAILNAYPVDWLVKNRRALVALRKKMTRETGITPHPAVLLAAFVKEIDA
jgi:hypothetical protein